MSEYDVTVCELKHAQNEKDHEAIKTLIQAVHDGDQRLLTREVMRISKELEKVESLETRVNRLEKWRIYLLGVSGTIVVLLPFVVNYIIKHTH